MPAIEISALLLAHGGTPPPHHVEVDAPDGLYLGGVRVTEKRAIVDGGQLRKLAASFPGRVRVIGPVSAAPTPAPVEAVVIATPEDASTVLGAGSPAHEAALEYLAAPATPPQRAKPRRKAGSAATPAPTPAPSPAADWDDPSLDF